MLSFIHTYTDNSFNALVKSGMWNNNDGLKLMHKPDFSEPNDFNSMLRRNSPLERLLRDLKCPFYIDRLQGGIGNKCKYKYDRSLINDLRKILKENFLGFQMHEWASNLRSDQQRILAMCDQEQIDMGKPKKLKELFNSVKDGKKELFLEAYTPTEWSERPIFNDLDSFLNEAQMLYKKRISETDGMLIPADSYYMAPKTEINNGAKILLPEVGWQIPNMRVQIAYTRGMANCAGINWGIYFECWQFTKNYGLTIPFSLRRGLDEWLEDMLHKGSGNELDFEKRENGGTSLSMMERAFIYAWFSGAKYIAEEYGICNTFRDLQSAELSPYGTVKKRFLDLIRTVHDVGVPYKPFAVVLPKEMQMLDVRLPENWFDFNARSDSVYNCINTKKTAEISGLIFGNNGRYGNFGHVLKNGNIPDLFDIIHEDTPTVSKYDHLVDLSGSVSFAGSHGNIITLNDVQKIIPEILPLIIDGELHTSYNKIADGWLILCMNHDGIKHDDFEPDVFLPQASVIARILKSDNLNLNKIAGNGILSKDGNEWSLQLNPGGWILFSV